MKTTLLSLILWLSTSTCFGQTPIPPPPVPPPPAMNFNTSPYSAYMAPQAAPAPAPPDECQEYSLIDDGQSMSQVPVRDQGDMGTCCSYAASEAIDAWRMSNAPQSVHFFTSPHALAAELANDSNGYFRAARSQATVPVESCADTSQAFSIAKKQGICSYDVLGANFDKVHLSQRNMWSQLKEDYDNWHDQYISALEDGDNEKMHSTLVAGQNQLNGFLCRAGLADHQFQDLNDIKSFILAKDPMKAFSFLTKKICNGHTEHLPADFPAPVTFSSKMIPAEQQANKARRNQIYNKMLTAMTNFKNKQPITIAFCANVLSDLNANSANPTAGMDQPCLGHAALIVGQKRMVDGRCGVLIRNSWGTDRDQAASNQLYSLTDDKGDMLIPKESLFNNLNEMSVLPPRGETYQPPQGLYDSPATNIPTINPAIPYPYNPPRPAQRGRPAK